MQTVEVRARNHRATFEIDPTDHIGKQIARGRFYEQDLLDDIATRVKPGLAVDVGAHIGNHTLYFAAILGFPVVALEPSEANRTALERNIAVNHLEDRVTVVPAAAGAGAGFCRIQNGHPGNTGMTRALYDPSGDVPVVALDDLGFSGVSVLKIDTEGCELEVLRGARQTIRRDKPIVYVESTDTHPRVKAFMEGLGYREFGCYAKTPTYGYAPARPITVSVAIMAHPKRKGFVEELVDALGTCSVVWDRQNDRWDTGRRSLLAFDPDATHHLVIQDDAIICRDLVKGLADALTVHPNSPVSLYFGRQRPRGPEMMRLAQQATAKGAHWIGVAELLWGVGVCLPTDLIPEIVSRADALKHVQNYDTRISTVLREKNLLTWYTFPSLVDHRRQEHSPSLVPGRTGENRVAHRFLGAEQSAKTVDWTTGAVTSSDARSRRAH